MGWWLITAATSPTPGPPQSSADSVTVALIVTLGSVVVALIGLGAQWVMKAAKGDDASSVIDPKLGERAAVLERLVSDGQTVLDVIDRRLDRAEDDIERLRWELARITTDRPPPP